MLRDQLKLWVFIVGGFPLRQGKGGYISQVHCWVGERFSRSIPKSGVLNFDERLSVKKELREAIRYLGDVCRRRRESSHIARGLRWS